MKKASKLALFVFLIAIAVIFVGCKGKRNVKLEIITDEQWYGTVIEGTTAWTPAPGWNKGETYNLGDFKDKIYAEIYKSTAYTTKTLTVRIVEEYEPGFLYVAQSEVKDSDSTKDNITPAKVMYNFGSTDK